MLKTITVSPKNSQYLYNRYNQKVISNDLISYLIYVARHYQARDKLKIVLESYNLNDVAKKDLRTALENNYAHLRQEYRRNNWRQILYFLVGSGILFIALLLHNYELFHELFIISGWVFIWKMIEIELFVDTENRERRVILKRLMKADIVIKKKGHEDIL